MFLFSAGLKSRQRTRFLLVIKGRGPLQAAVSFLFLFACNNSVLFKYCLVQRPLRISSFVFFRYLIGNFLFLLFSSDLRSRTFFFFLFSFEGEDGNSHPGSRFMVSCDFGSRLVERLDMIYVRVLVWPAVQG